MVYSDDEEAYYRARPAPRFDTLLSNRRLDNHTPDYLLRNNDLSRANDAAMVVRPRPSRKVTLPSEIVVERSPQRNLRSPVKRGSRTPSPPPRDRNNGRIVAREKIREPSPPSPSPPTSRERDRERILRQERVRTERSRSPPRERSPSWVFVDDRPEGRQRMKDVTIHLELDVAEDLEPDLEEFNRLSRIGNFRAAKKFFQDNLAQYMENPYVHAQYSQMLIDMGDFKTQPSGVFPYDPNYITVEGKDLVLYTNSIMIAVLRTLHTGELLPSPLEDEFSVQTSTGRPLGIDRRDLALGILGSTECQTLAIFFRIYRGNEGMKIDYDFFAWKLIYRNLLRHGRIWDLRDILTGAFQYYGIDRVCIGIFGTEFVACKDLPDRLLLDWEPTIYNESINLGLLDILIFIAFGGLYPHGAISGSIAHAKTAVNKGSQLVSSMIQNNPRNLKSRQYIQWVLAQIAVTNYPMLHNNDFIESGPSSPGFLINTADQTIDFPTKIYVPAASEFSTWKIPEPPARSEETLIMMLEASRQLEDYHTEALCLKQLVFHSNDRIKIFDQLIHLRKAHGDLEGWLASCLSKYIVCKDRLSRDHLRQEILSVTDIENFDCELLWARLMILRALSKTAEERDALLEKARVAVRRLYGSKEVEFMKRNNLLTEDLHEVGAVGKSSRREQRKQILDGEHEDQIDDDSSSSETSSLKEYESAPSDTGHEDLGKDNIDPAQPKRQAEMTNQPGAGSLQRSVPKRHMTIEDAPEPSEVEEVDGPTLSPTSFGNSEHEFYEVE